MTFDLHTAALLLGIILLLVALFGGALFATSARTLRVTLGIVGAALIAGAALPYLTRPHAAAAPQAVSAPAPAPVAPESVALPGDAARAATAALEDCSVPNAPGVPDAAKASRAEMVAAHTAFQAFDTATNTYTACVDAAVDKVSKDFAQAPAADLQTVRVLGTGAHNTAVDQEQALADQFNVQVKAFKAKHPGE